jgi:glycerophosphoryl diester phosphodiesterase
MRILGIEEDRPLISWHRGGSEVAQSASEAAFSAAVQLGAEFIEVDVRQSRDSVLLCIHDDQVPGLGPVDRIDFAALSEVERGGILTFERFAEILDVGDESRKTGVHHDIKAQGYELAAVDLLVAHGRPQFVTTTFASSVKLIRDQRPDVPAYLTIGTSRAGLSRIATLRLRLGETFPMWRIYRCRAQGIAIHHRLATPLIRWWCRQRSLAIVVWTIDRDELLDRWMDRGVDVITTNRPLRGIDRRHKWRENHR